MTGAALDGISIYTASRPIRRTAQVAAAWSAASVLALRLGRLGVFAGTAIAPGPGTAAGGGIGVILGGIIGYAIAETGVGIVYDWAEDTFFAAAEEVPVAPGQLPASP